MENKQITITALQKKSVQTKYGIKEKMSIVASDGITYDSFVGDWNRQWKQGDTVSGVAESRVYNGKTYWDLKAPPEMRSQQGQSGMAGAQIIAKLEALEKKIDLIMEATVRRPDGNEPPPFDGDDLPF